MSQSMPPWLQEQIAKLNQAQQNLQSVMTQIQHLEIEKAETAKALEELDKVKQGDDVFKSAGSILVKSTKQDMTDDLKERQELINTRLTIAQKHETSVKGSLKEQEAKITEFMKGNQNPRK